MFWCVVSFYKFLGCKCYVRNGEFNKSVGVFVSWMDREGIILIERKFLVLVGMVIWKKNEI